MRRDRQSRMLAMLNQNRTAMYFLACTDEFLRLVDALSPERLKDFEAWDNARSGNGKLGSSDWPGLKDQFPPPLRDIKWRKHPRGQKLFPLPDWIEKQLPELRANA